MIIILVPGCWLIHNLHSGYRLHTLPVILLLIYETILHFLLCSIDLIITHRFFFVDRTRRHFFVDSYSNVSHFGIRIARFLFGIGQTPNPVTTTRREDIVRA